MALRQKTTTRSEAPPKAAACVLGAGNWGTALAKHLADIGHWVTLWCRRTEHAHAIMARRENAQYLSGISLPETILVTADIARALADAELVVMVVPTAATRETARHVRPHIRRGVPIVSASKGIELSSLSLMSMVLEDELSGHPVAVLAGPSFAREVAEHAPTAVVLASSDAQVARDLQNRFRSDWFRTYVSDDVIGLEIGGALKNIIAIACGISDGLGFGHNARAALMTRGLHEITKMAVRLGGRQATLSGLGGLGDLVLTCTGDLSRNRRVGIELGRGGHVADILSRMGQVAEGVGAARAAQMLSAREGIEMPIVDEMVKILYESKSPRKSVADLMRRELKHEQA